MKCISVILLLFLIGYNVAAKDIEKNETYWREKISQSPEKALNYFNLGVTLYGEKNYRKALWAYRQVIKRKSKLTPICHYYMAIIYKKLEDNKKARLAVSKISMATIPTNLKSRVLLFKNKLFAEDIDLNTDNALDNEDKKSFFGYGEISIGQNSNPLYQSEVDSTSTLEADRQLQARAGISYNLLSTDYFETKVSYNYFGKFYKENSTSNFSYQELQLPLSVYFSLYRLRLTPEIIFDTFADESFSKSSGGSMDLTRRFGSTFITLGFDYKDVAIQDTDFSFLDGDTRKFYLSGRWRMGSSDFSLSTYYKNYDYLDDSTFSVSYDGIGVDAAYYFYQDQWTWTFSAGIEHRDYKLAPNETNNRKDLRLSAGAQLSYALNKNFRLFGDASFLSNNSNFEEVNNNKSYNQAVFSGGLGFSF